MLFAVVVLLAVSATLIEVNRPLERPRRGPLPIEPHRQLTPVRRYDRAGTLPGVRAGFGGPRPRDPGGTRRGARVPDRRIRHQGVTEDRPLQIGTCQVAAREVGVREVRAPEVVPEVHVVVVAAGQLRPRRSAPARFVPTVDAQPRLVPTSVAPVTGGADPSTSSSGAVLVPIRQHREFSVIFHCHIREKTLEIPCSTTRRASLAHDRTRFRKKPMVVKSRRVVYKPVRCSVPASTC